MAHTHTSSGSMPATEFDPGSVAPFHAGLALKLALATVEGRLR